MRMAQEADPVRSVNWISSEPVAMIEFQVACLAAPLAFLVGETAAAAHDPSLLVLGARRARARSKWFSVSFGVGVDAACPAPARIGCAHPDGLPGSALDPSADARARSMNARPYILSAACWLCAWHRRRIRSAR